MFPVIKPGSNVPPMHLRYGGRYCRGYCSDMRTEVAGNIAHPSLYPWHACQGDSSMPAIELCGGSSCRRPSSDKCPRRYQRLRRRYIGGIWEPGLSPDSDQHQFLLKISIDNQRERLWELIKWSPQRKCFDLSSNSLSSFFKEKYRDQCGEFVCGFWGLKS